MTIFRADHYLIAEFKEMTDARKECERVMEALQGLSALKDLAVVSRRLEGKQWSEVLGRVDIPEGSKSFWGMVKKELTEREPYHLFMRIDINGEGETIEDARRNAKQWIEAEFVSRIKKHIPVKDIQVLQANEIYMPKID